jgi:hypothetical protein
MADTRINALSTATVSLSDDFLPIDGTTAGTKKLSAYSPSFGGNATVGGTLTVTGALTTSSIVNNGANGVSLDTGGSASLRFTDSATSKWWIYKLSGDSLLYFRDMVNSRMQMSMTPGATSSAALTILSSSVLIDSTTASTTASSGALVVSGGLGVAGAINAGGAITAGTDGSLVAVYVPGDSALRAAGGKLYLDTRLTDGGDIVLRPRISAALTLTAATNAATFTGAVSVSSTTASTSTSSGALVVSGGVGVAKEMYLGGGLLNVAKAGAGATIEINADSGFASKLAMQRAATNRWTLEVDSSDVLTLKSLGTTAALTMTGTTSAEFVGSIKTAAPSGGTAANWKLGTVATVSPTSPNRTIEVDIGGTIYYIHAKTTNN